MRVGIDIHQFDFPGAPASIGPSVAKAARQAEDAGFASLWVMDHFFQIERWGPADAPMLESYATLAFAAGATSRITVGTMVTGVMYRYPGILIKTVTTLDVLSGGRAWLGIGAGWYEREHLALGVPFPPLKERFERLEEALQIALQMWSGEAKPYEGRRYHLAETLCRPQPLSRPHPPILIGGGGEQKTLRLVAKYGDACNLFAHDLDQLRHKLDVLRAHCDREGRDYATIEKTAQTGLVVARQRGDGKVTPSEVVDRLGQLAELGVDHAIFPFPSDNPAAFELLATEVVPEAAKLRAVGR
ncbi:MAG TPA: LLM class F420-dependent oxidoreductase [Thermomicrobiales bacterium]|nr:LLM class F420-dependent oxidoreductase [Thermomicrobiales bacterium]